MIIDVHTHIVPEQFPPVGSRMAGAGWPVMDHTAPGTANVMINGSNYRTVFANCWDVPTRVAAFPAEGDRDVQAELVHRRHAAHGEVAARE